MRTAERGLKVIIADGECQLARQRRVRAEDAEKLKRGERVTRDALRRRRRDLHRRPFLHPAVGLPVADGEAQSRSAAHRSGGDGDRKLRRLRPVRRGRACRGAVPVVLSRRGRAQSELVGPTLHRVRRASSAGWRARRAVSLSPVRARVEVSGRTSTSEPLTPPLSPAGRGSRRACRREAPTAAASHHPPDRRARRRRRRRADRLDRQRRATRSGFPVQSTSIPGVAQRTGATTYYIEIMPVPARDSAAGSRCWRSRPASATSTS